MDGEYTSYLSFYFDIKCFLGSLHVFGKDESVVEGGTGEMHKQEKRQAWNEMHGEDEFQMRK